MSAFPHFARLCTRARKRHRPRQINLPQIRLHLDFMEAELARSAWFAGDDFSAADVQMSFPVEAARARAGLDASRPRLMDYLARIHARHGYRQALAKGGPYTILKV